jgi:hypothetical protein
MTTPTTPQQQAEQFREELRADIVAILAELAELRADIVAIREGLTRASQPATATQPGNFAEMEIDAIIMSYDDNGKPTYKAKGAPYIKHGVRIWDEIIPRLDIDPASLKPGANPLPQPVRARVLMGETTREDGTKAPSPRKVTGKI